MTSDLASIHGAIELVAARRASRVTLSGLRFGERLLPRASADARQRGVDLRVDRGTQGIAAIVVTTAQG